MRISDWSSDVCSSDLCDLLFPAQGHRPTDPVLQSFTDRVLGLGILLWPGRWTPPDRWSRAGVADHAFDRAERDDVRAGNSVFGESASDNAWPLHRLASFADTPLHRPRRHDVHAQFGPGFV